MGLLRRRRAVRRFRRLRRVAVLGGAVGGVLAWRERQMNRNEGQPPGGGSGGSAGSAGGA